MTEWMDRGPRHHISSGLQSKTDNITHAYNNQAQIKQWAN